MNETPIALAIRLAGGSRQVAKAFGVTRQAVEQWDECPPLRVRDLEALSGVSRHDLRPDIYGPAPETEGAAA